MKFDTFFRRFLIPSFLVSILYYLKFKCKISPKAEVEWTPNLRIGRNTIIGSFTKIKATEGMLIIGDDVSIATGCQLMTGAAGMEIGRDCLLSPYVVVISGSYRYDRLDVPIRLQGQVSKGTKIGENVWIGAGACILDGAEIGSGSIILPNAVVSSSIPQNSIIQGNPAKVIFTRR